MYRSRMGMEDIFPEKLEAVAALDSVVPTSKLLHLCSFLHRWIERKDPILVLDAFPSEIFIQSLFETTYAFRNYHVIHLHCHENTSASTLLYNLRQAYGKAIWIKNKRILKPKNGKSVLLCLSGLHVPKYIPFDCISENEFHSDRIDMEPYRCMLV